MTSDRTRTSKKAWIKPEMRRLQLSDDEIAGLFPDHAVAPSRRHQAVG